jgi:hypothetical protein
LDGLYNCEQIRQECFRTFKTAAVLGGVQVPDPPARSAKWHGPVRRPGAPEVPATRYWCLQPCRMRNTRRCGNFGSRRAAYFRSRAAASQPASYGVVFSSGSSGATSASRGWRRVHLKSCTHTSVLARNCPQLTFVLSSRPRRFSLAIRTDRRLLCDRQCVCMHAGAYYARCGRP